MKLLYRIIIRLSVILSIVLAIWAVFFYMAMIDEINDEVDDSLEDYSEYIIVKALAGEDLPSRNNGSNNEYFLSEIEPEYANNHPHVSYKDSMVYIPAKGETEPARVLTTIYKNKEEAYFQLTVLTPAIEKKDLKEAILYWIIFLYVGLLFVIILINIGVYYKSNRPLYVLLRWIDNYKVGGQNNPLENETDIVEFRKLNDAVVRGMNRAEQVFEEQKQFIGNASHEIQTPLAVSRNRLETLMEDETLTEKQLGEIVKTHQTLEYITRLNKSLLLLSKIDNRQFSETEPVVFNHILHRYIEDYQEVYSYMNIDLKISEAETFGTNMNLLLAEIMLNNLLKNAYVHNVTSGQIVIEIFAGRMIIRNSGQDYPLNEKYIFDRFYQGNKKEGSTGLGLAIVKSICEMSGLVIRYSFDGRLHCFEVSQ